MGVRTSIGKSFPEEVMPRKTLEGRAGVGSTGGGQFRQREQQEGAGLKTRNWVAVPTGISVLAPAAQAGALSALPA